MKRGEESQGAGVVLVLDFLKVDMLDWRYTPVNFGAGTNLGSVDWWDKIQGCLAHKKPPLPLGPP